MKFNIDSLRRFYLSVAEATDAWRIVPRLLVTGYGYLLYSVVTWYSELAPYMLEGCVSETVTDCIIRAPSTQHAALVTAVVGVAAAFFGLYTNSGQKWDRYVFRKWNTDNPILPEGALPEDNRNFFKQKTAYEIMPSLVGSEMCIRDSHHQLLSKGIKISSCLATFSILYLPRNARK